MKNNISPALVAGFGAAVLSTIPYVRSFTCCLLVPAAVFLALFFHFKLVGFYTIRFDRAILLGILTGIFAALFGTVFDSLITYLTRSNDFLMVSGEVEKMLRSYFVGSELEQSITLIRRIATEINTKGFSPMYTFMLFIGNLFSNIVMGALGGILAAVYFHKRLSDSQ